MAENKEIKPWYLNINDVSSSSLNKEKYQIQLMECLENSVDENDLNVAEAVYKVLSSGKIHILKHFIYILEHQ